LAKPSQTIRIDCRPEVCPTIARMPMNGTINFG
jgi:hypothetical protein